MTVVVVEGIEVGKVSGVGENGATEMATASGANGIDTITTADATDGPSGISKYGLTGLYFFCVTLFPYPFPAPSPARSIVRFSSCVLAISQLPLDSLLITKDKVAEPWAGGRRACPNSLMSMQMSVPA